MGIMYQIVMVTASLCGVLLKSTNFKKDWKRQNIPILSSKH